MAVHHTPKGYHTATPYLIVRNGSAALGFYQRAFGAVELFRLAGPDGLIGHAEIRIGDSNIMLADEMPAMGYVGPATLGGTPVSLMLYLPEVDKIFQQALDAGATSQKPVQNQFYGDRSGTLKDPFGHVWTISTHVEDVAPEEMQRRAEAWMKKSKEEHT